MAETQKALETEAKKRKYSTLQPVIVAAEPAHKRQRISDEQCVSIFDQIAARRKKKRITGYAAVLDKCGLKMAPEAATEKKVRFATSREAMPAAQASSKATTMGSTSIFKNLFGANRGTDTDDVMQSTIVGIKLTDLSDIYNQLGAEGVASKTAVSEEKAIEMIKERIGLSERMSVADFAKRADAKRGECALSIGSAAVGVATGSMFVACRAAWTAYAVKDVSHGMRLLLQALPSGRSKKDAKGKLSKSAISARARICRVELLCPSAT